MSIFFKEKGKQFSQQNQVKSEIAKELQFRTIKLWGTKGKSGEQKRRVFFYRKKEGAGRSWGYFKYKFIGGKWEFKVVVASHWLQAISVVALATGEGSLLLLGTCSSLLQGWEGVVLLLALLYTLRWVMCVRALSLWLPNYRCFLKIFSQCIYVSIDILVSHTH